MCARNLAEMLTGLFKPVSQCGDNRSLCLDYEMQFPACNPLAHCGGGEGLLLLKIFYLIIFIYFACVCMCVCEGVQVSAGTHRGQRQSSPGLEL